MENMNKTIILAVMLFVGCSSMARVNIGPVGVEIPSGWKHGTIGTGGSGICITVLGKDAGNTVNTIVSDMERLMDRPSQSANTDGSITMFGMMNNPYARKYVSVGDFTMTVRDVLVEAKRIQMTDKTSNTDPVDVAKINVREMALILDDAKKQGLIPTSEQVDQQVQASFDQATKSGLTKEKFLANWGITEEEFRFINTQKLAYESVLRQVTATAKDDKDYASLATAYKNKLMVRSDYGFWDIAPENAKVNIKDVGNAFVVTMGFGDDYDFDTVAKSISLDGDFTEGMVLLAGSSDK